MEQKTIIINGFEEKEISSLYQFLDFYEDNDLKNCNEGDAIKKVPSLTEMKAIMNSFTHDEKSISKLKSINIESLNDELYYTKKTSEFMGFLYHLRNSIAHANILKDGEMVKITDYDIKNTNPQCTAKGKIKYEIIQNMVDIINKKR